MYVKLEPFGYNIYGETIGSVWLSLIEAVLKNGELSNDESRERLALQNIRIRSITQAFPDELIKRYGNKKNIDAIIHLTFDEEIMYDFDVIPSFTPGAKSYYARIKEGRMIEFIVKRLSDIPESKKAVISFIHWDDYKAVLNTPKDDYLPCITSIQFRLLKISNEKGYHMNTIFNARSIDVFQKANGNFAAMVLLSKKIAEELTKSLKTPVWCGSLDGMISDAHIYQECFKSAEKIIREYKKYG